MSEVSRIDIFEVTWKTVQEFCVGRGKDELNSVRSCLFEVQCQAGTVPKEREGMSEMEFSWPRMWSVVIGQACACFIQRERA